MTGDGSAGMQGTAAAEEDGSTAVGAQGTLGGGEKVEWLVGQPLPCLNRHPTAGEGSFCAFSLLPANLAILAFLQHIKI